MYPEFIANFKDLLTYISENSPTITKNYAEKSLNGILEYVSGLNANTPTEVQLELYELCLDKLCTTFPNDRLWFKTHIKQGKLMLLEKRFPKVQQICDDLTHWCEGLGGAMSSSVTRQVSEMDTENVVDLHRRASVTTSSSGKGAQLLEIYAWAGLDLF